MRGKVIRRCKVRGCINNLKTNPNVALFRVPNNNTEVLEKWVQECGDTDYLEVPMKYLKDNLKMCSAHFLPDQIKRTALLTRLKEPVAPTIFEGCVGRQPFTDEQIVAWRRTKQYGANYDATLEKKKAQKEQLSHILKEALAGEDSASSIESEFMKEPLGGDDLASTIGSECTFSTSTEGSAEQASHEWAPSNLVLQIGNRLVAIPALSIPIPGME